MKDPVKRWLAAQIAQVDSVRGCTTDREADIAAFTWSANVTHIYLIDTLPKVRQLKKMIGDNSRVGIGTLFIVDTGLLPPDGAKVIPDETLVALHALFKDKIYTYRVDEHEQPHIGQVHLRSFGRGDEREVWYGPDIEIRHLPCYRVWVKAPHSVKGDWLVANFGSEGFWKASDYTTGRDSVRRQQRGATQHFTWSKSSFGDTRLEENGAKAAPPPTPPVQSTRLDTSYAQLGLSNGASNDEVKSAFRKKALELHPDVSNLPKEEAELRFKLLSEAYTYIKVKMGW
jgi:hypothetical protein